MIVPYVPYETMLTFLPFVAAFSVLLGLFTIGVARVKGSLLGRQVRRDDPADTTPITLLVAVAVGAMGPAVVPIVAAMGSGVGVLPSAGVLVGGLLVWGGTISLASALVDLPTYLSLGRADERGTGTAANADDGETIAVRGEPSASEPATAPFTGEDALFVHYTVEARDASDREIVHRDDREAAFTLDDGSGRIRVVTEGPYFDVEPERVAVGDRANESVSESIPWLESYQSTEEAPERITAFHESTEFDDRLVTADTYEYEQWVLPADADGLTAFGELRHEGGRPTLHATAFRTDDSGDPPERIAGSVAGVPERLAAVLVGAGLVLLPLVL